MLNAEMSYENKYKIMECQDTAFQPEEKQRELTNDLEGLQGL